MYSENAPLELTLALSDHRADCDSTRAKVQRIVATKDFDWGQFVSLMLFHKVAFVAWHRLQEIHALETVLSSGMPLLLFNHWTQLYHVNKRRTELQFNALRDISSGLDGAGVTWMVGKGGPLLLDKCYPIGVRKMYDLDLLASREQLESVKSGMADAGFLLGSWSPDRSSIDPLPAGELRKWLLHSRGLPNFLSIQDDPVVDYLVAQVQFRVGSTSSGNRSVPAEELLQSATTRNMKWGEGSPFPVSAPSSIDLLIQLALHIARETTDPEHAEWHMSWNIIKLADLARYVDANEIDTHTLVHRANELGMRQQLRYAIGAVSVVFPSERLAGISDSLGIVSMPTRADLAHAFLEVANATTRSRSAWTSIVGAKTS